MRKALIDKRIGIFKEMFPEYKTSKKGNFYVRIVSKGPDVKNKWGASMFGKLEDRGYVKKEITITGRGATKSMLDKIGDVIIRKEDVALKVLITPRGKLMTKLDGSGNRFKLMTLKSLFMIGTGEYYDQKYRYGFKKEDLENLFFTGRKYEYLKAYPNLRAWKLFQNFNSLKEAKNFLGYDFISCKDFYDLFPSDALKGDMIRALWVAKTHDEKVNVVNLLRKGKLNFFVDYLDMAKQLEVKSVEIPYGANKLTELHDNLVVELNKGKADKYSDEVLVYRI